MKQPAVYIMANKRNGTLYTGVTSNLVKRVYEHKNSLTEGFTQKHSCHLLVFFEVHSTMEYAISREKQIKAGSRAKKLKLIENSNPDWRDLYTDIVVLDCRVATSPRNDERGNRDHKNNEVLPS